MQRNNVCPQIRHTTVVYNSGLHNKTIMKRLWLILLFFLTCTLAQGRLQARSQLVSNIATIVASNNADSASCATLHDAARQLGIDELDAYASLLQNRQLDTCNQQRIAATTALLEKTEKEFGKVSVEAIKCRRAKLAAIFSYDDHLALQLANENERASMLLFQQNRNDWKREELSLLCRLENMVSYNFIYADNPAYNIEAYNIEQKTDSLYAIHKEDSDTKIEIYFYLACLKPTTTDYPNSLSFAYGALGADTRIPTYIYNSTIPSNALGYYTEARDMAQRMFGDNDLRTIKAQLDLIEFNYANSTAEYDDMRAALLQVIAKLKATLHPSDGMTLNAQKLLWEYDIRAGKHLDETNDYKSFLTQARESYGERSKLYFKNVYDIMNQRLRVNPSQASSLLDDVTMLADSVYHDDSDNQSVIYQLAANAAYAIGDSKRHADYLEKGIDFFKKSIDDLNDDNDREISWLTILMAHCLRNNFDEAMDLKSACSMSSHVLSLLKPLTINTRPLIISTETIYAEELLTHSTFMSAMQDFDNAVKACMEAKEIYEKCHISTPRIYHELSSIYNTMGDSAKCMNTIDEAIEKTRDNKDWNYFYILKKASMLAGNPIHATEYEQLINDGYRLFKKHEDGIGGIFFECYFIINNYLQSHKRYDEAEKLLLRGLDQFNAIDGNYNETFMQFLNEIVSIYTDQFNDYDKAEAFLEAHTKNIIEDPTNTNHEQKLKFLWMKYNLTKIKSEDLNNQSYLLQQMIDEANAIAKTTNDEELKNYINVKYIMPILYQWVYTFTPYLNIMENLTQVPTEWNEAMNNNIDKNAALEMSRNVTGMFNNLTDYMPDLGNNIRSLYSDYMQRFEYAEYLNTYSTLMLYVKKDTARAESILLQGLSSTNNGVLYKTNTNLAGFYLDTNQPEKAIACYHNMETLAKNLPAAMPDTASKSKFYLDWCTAYYMAHNYDKSIDYALKHYRLQRQIIDNNINLMTAAERESFMSLNKGIGNLQLKVLLPHDPDRLAAEVYNSVLAEKGYLLRASERIRNGILKSGDSELRQMFDSLSTMQEEQKRHKTSDFNFNTLETTFNDDIIRQQRAIDNLEHNINRRIASLGLAADSTPDWQAVRAALGSKEMAIEFVLADSMLCALTIKSNSTVPQCIKLGGLHNVSDWFNKNKLLSEKQKAEEIYQNDVLHLYEQLWQPLEPLMQDMDCIYFSPSAFLNMLSLGAVRRPDGSYMLDRYNLQQLTSTAMLANRRHTHGSNKKDIALYGAVCYSDEQNLNTPQPAQRGAVGEAFGFLPFTRDEVDSIAALLRQTNANCRVITGSEASESSVRSMSGSSPYVLHLATHGFFVSNDADVESNTFLAQFPATRYQSMTRAGMALAGANTTWAEGNADTENDGILTAEEVASLNFDGTRLAVLSACETGLGMYSDEGVYGMYRGFKQAGVESILASLWTVNDSSTSRLMRAFYSNWIQGATMRQSYIAAMQEIRRQFPSPYYWAPFVLIDAVEQQ